MTDHLPLPTTPCLCSTLRKVTRNVTKVFDAHLKPCGLRVGQYSLLANIARNPGITVSALAGLMHMDQTTVTRNLQLLKKEKYIEMSPSVADRRIKAINLRQAGREALRQAFPLWEQAQAEWARRVGAPDFDHLLRSLQSVIR